MGEADIEKTDPVAPDRDSNPRGPDAPAERELGPGVPSGIGSTFTLRQDQTPDDHLAHRAQRAIPPSKGWLLGVSAPAIRWVGTGYNYDAGRGGYAVKGIVIHTEVGNNVGSTSAFQNPNRQASAHYGVAIDGHEVVQWVSEPNTAWHCGRYLPDGSHMGNRDSIGIEHEDNGQYNSPRPDGLYETSARLVAWICERYGLPANHNTVRGECGHREVSALGTACPDSLDVDRIIARAAQLLTAPKPPVVPPWKLALHSEAYTVTLGKAAILYNLETGADSGARVSPGTLTTAYRGTIGGKDYRVTAYSFDHDTPRGVLTADVAPPKPPDPVAEWKKNLTPQAGTFRLTKPVGLYSLLAPHPEAAAPVSMVPAGPLVVAYLTSVGGQNFLITDYSILHGHATGMLQAEVKAADAPPTPKPPDPPKPPQPPDPNPIPGAPPGFFQALLEFLRKFFGGK